MIQRVLFLGLLVTAVGGCEGMARRNIEVAHSSGTDSATVARAVSEFGAKQGFNCSEQPGPVVLECRARGPRFMSVTSEPNSSVAELAQPFPWSPSGAPELYEQTVEAFTRFMSDRFGSSARIEK